MDVAPLISFDTFVSSSHSGMALKVWKAGHLHEFGLSYKSISVATEDGASNNKKAAKLAGVPFEVCHPHHLNRANLFAAGIAGKISLNLEMKAFIEKNSTMAASFSRSGTHNAALSDHQVAAGIQKSKV